MVSLLPSSSCRLCPVALRKLAVVALGLLLLMPGSARAESYDLFKWCVTYYINSTKPHPAGKFETVNAVERIQKCNYLR